MQEECLMQVTVGKCGPVHARVRAPPSKSYTHRALILAGLADGRSIITGQLDADDTRITARALGMLGVRISWEKNRITVDGTAGRLLVPVDPIDSEDSGTSMRLITAVCLLSGGPVMLTGSARMQQRPVGPLVDALNASGGKIRYTGTSGFPPLLIEGVLSGGDIVVDGSISSQFISSLLIVAPYAQKDTRIILTGGIVSEPYIRITTSMMEIFGVSPVRSEPGTWSIRSGMGYRPTDYTVEGDYSSASYWFGMAAITGGEITVEGLNTRSLQGDRKMLDILREMGCRVAMKESEGLTQSGEITVSRSGPLTGVDIDMSDCPDIVQTVAMVAAIAQSPTRITGIHHLREKESDRVAAIVQGLESMGLRVQARWDEIIIHPGTVSGGIINPARDHRTAMCFAMLGSGVGDVTILEGKCVSKSYPEFWEVFREVWSTGGSC